MFMDNMFLYEIGESWVFFYKRVAIQKGDCNIEMISEDSPLSVLYNRQQIRLAYS